MTAPLHKRVKRAVRYALLRVVLLPLQLLPLAWAGNLGALLGRLTYALARGERRKALASLAVAFPEKSDDERRQLARASFTHLGRMALELIRVPAIDARMDAVVEIDAASRAVMDEAVAHGKGVILVTGHCGNWELLARSLTHAGYPLTAIGKPTSDARTTKLVEDFRAGGRVRTLWRGQEGMGKALMQTLRDNHVLGILIDQDTQVPSVFVPFFGRPAKTPRAVPDLACRSGARVVLGFCTRMGPQRYRVTVQAVEGPASDSEEAAVAMTAELTAGIEQHVRAWPEQWVWMHQRWKSTP